MAVQTTSLYENSHGSNFSVVWDDQTLLVSYLQIHTDPSEPGNLSFVGTLYGQQIVKTYQPGTDVTWSPPVPISITTSRTPRGTLSVTFSGVASLGVTTG